MMFSSLLVVACLTAPHATPVDAIENWRALYAQGVAFRTFLDAADERRQAWHDNYRLGVVPETLQSRARAVPGRWHVLVVAEDWCGDSVNTVPYLARLVERLDRVDLRVVDSDMGRHDR